MLLTAKQVAEKLGVSAATVRVWGKEGRFGEGKKIGTGKKKQHLLYDSKAVNEFIKNNKVPKVKITHETSGPKQFLMTLDRIEQKLDTLIKMWS